MGTSDWIALGELVVAIIGIIVGCIGGKELSEANKIKIKLGDIEAKIGNLEINNSQIASIINNNGIGIKDAEYVAEKVVDKKTENKPDMFYSEEVPEDAKQMSVWIGGREDISDT